MDADRKMAAKTIGLGLLLLTCAILLARGAAHAISAALAPLERERQSEGLGRVRAFVDALPRIAQDPAPKILVVGSSLIEHGFSPAAFDDELRARGVQAKSWNAGIPGTNGQVEHVLALRIVESGLRPLATLVEFTTFLATVARRPATGFA